jgi:hypothetical protein
LRQKNPAVPTFEPKIFGREKFQTVRAGRDRPEKFPGSMHAPSEVYAKRGIFPTFVAIFLNFFRAKGIPAVRYQKTTRQVTSRNFKFV